MKRHIQVAMLGLIVLVMGVIAACGSGPEIPDDVSYEIKHVEKGGSDDTTFVDIGVEINRAVACDTIRAIADEVRNDYPESRYVYRWIGFYLTDGSMLGDDGRLDSSSAWTIAIHNGDDPAEVVAFRRGCQETD